MDCALGAGIAKQFTVKYPELRSFLKLQTIGIGDAVLYQDNNTNDIVINLVTKAKYFHKPTLLSLTCAIYNMKSLVIEHGIKKIGMPLIGCGLDRLDWTSVSIVLKDAFKDTDVELLICIKE